MYRRLSRQITPAQRDYEYLLVRSGELEIWREQKGMLIYYTDFPDLILR
jgi:hypothetical protein